ncbi:HTH domain-containing protein [Dyadobacter tibetensis]|uniref:HTH domain-containing protein n=1 Tax=Dyadobacter tibetensis TaxID=1211851 RepID=UPI0004701116|nr:HTH domain-containing protein [Dyadobacter tibetensis]
MDLTKYIERLDRLHRLISRKATGSPADLAAKLNISKRALHEYLGVMREMGAPIVFCHSRRTYYYERSVKFNMGFQELNDEKAQSSE